MVISQEGYFFKSAGGTCTISNTTIFEVFCAQDLEEIAARKKSNYDIHSGVAIGCGVTSLRRA